MKKYEVYSKRIKVNELDLTILDTLKKISDDFQFEIIIKNENDKKMFETLSSFSANNKTFSNLNEHWENPGKYSKKTDKSIVDYVLNCFTNCSHRKYSSFIILFDRIKWINCKRITEPTHGYEFAKSGYSVSGNYLSNYVMLFRNFLDDHITLFVCFDESLTQLEFINTTIDYNFDNSCKYKEFYAPENEAERTERNRIMQSKKTSRISCIDYIKEIVNEEDLRMTNSYFLKTSNSKLNKNTLLVNENIKREYEKKVNIDKSIINMFAEKGRIYKKINNTDHSFSKKIGNDTLEIIDLSRKKGHDLYMNISYYGKEFCFYDNSIYFQRLANKEEIKQYYMNTYIISEKIYEHLSKQHQQQSSIR